ncbi:MAG: DHH family phosphoesterase [Planctomycetota bacterium]
MTPSDVEVSAFADELRGSKRVLLTTHVRPDGDALGTTAALQRALASLGFDASCLVLSEIPEKYAFLYHGVPHQVMQQGVPPAPHFDGVDTLLVCDTGTWSQLPSLRETVEAFDGRKLVLDHHLTQEDWPDRHLVDTTAGAAAEVAMRLIHTLDVSIDEPMAVALFAAMATDTGWFGYSNASARTFQLAGECVAAGADPDALMARLYRSERPQKIQLFAKGLSSLDLRHDDRLAVMTLRRSDYQAADAEAQDSEDLINEPMKIASVAVSLLVGEPLTPDPTGKQAIKVSLRSKGQVDCAALLQPFGGGGHARAAGARVEGDIDTVRERVAEAVFQLL